MIRRPKMLCGIIAFLASMAFLSQNAGCGSRGASTHSDAGPPADAHLDASSPDARAPDAGTDLMRRRAGFGAVAPQGGTITSVIAGTSLSGGGTSGAVTLSANLPGGTCGVGSAVTAVASTGAVTCGAAGVSNAAGVNVIPVSTGAGSGFGSSGETDDGTTFSSSRNAFVTGAFTGSGAATFKSTETVWGNWAGSGNVTLGDAAADQIAFNGSASTPLDMNNHKVLNVTNGTAAQDAAAFGQIASGVNSAVSGTSGRIPKFTGTNTVGNSAGSDDGTTFNIGGTTIFAVTEANGNTAIGGSLTTTGAVVNKSTETVWGNWTGSGDVALGDATADHISFNGSAATLLNMNTHTITAVVDPSNPQDAATKHYVDSVAIVGAVAGTTNRMVKFTAANAVGDALGPINLGSASSDTLTVAATTTFNAPVTAAGNLVSTAGTTTIGNLRGQTIAPTLTGGATVGDWAPTNSGTARSVFANCPSGTCTIDGLVGGADGREITIYNTGAGAIALPNNNSGATAANRWNNATGTEFLVANAGCSADYTYSTADNFWHLTGHICSQWAEDGATATTTRNLQVSGTGTFNSWITAGNSIYGGGGPAAIYLSSGVGGVGLVPGMNCRYSSNAADTCYINAVGYAEGSTQPRSLSIQDGQGSAAAHTLAFFDGANNGVTLGSGAATKITMANQPIGGAGTASGRHWENYEEFMLGGAGYASGTPMGAWEYINSGGAGYLESNVYDITGGGVATGRPGVLQLQYSAASPASGYTQISMSSSSAFADGNWSMDGALAVSALSSNSSASASLYGFWFGFHDALSATSLATNGCYFQYNGAVDTTHLSCVCAAASVRTTYQIAGAGNSDESFPLGTATVAATTYMNLLVKMTGTTRAEFFYNGTKVCDINTHIPTAANVTSPRIVLSTAQATGTGARNLFIDWVRVSVDLTSTRSP